VSDLVLFEDYPAAYPADCQPAVSLDARRLANRVVAPARVPGTDAKPVANPISALSRWKIFDNLRRSVVPVALLALLFSAVPAERHAVVHVACCRLRSAWVPNGRGGVIAAAG